MLHGIDDIDWSALDGAYGPCTEAPDILRGLASPDPDEAGEAMYELGSSLWHQGTVYPATVEAIPYLIELATTDGVHRRADLLRILGDVCDPTLTGGRDQPLVRAAVAVHSGPLLPLLTDADPRIRAHAAYAAAHSGPHTLDTLRERWAVEDHPAVRAAVLAALAHLEPAVTVPLLSAALHDPSPKLRATAATALVRSGGSLPPDTLEPVGAALAAAGAEDTPWAGHRSAWDVVFAATEPAAAAVLAAPLARSADPDVRSRLLHSVNARLLHSRSSVAALFPLVAPLLADPDPEVRSDAAVAALAAGPAAAPAADGLLDVARGGSRCALLALIRLGHPGYPEALAAAWAAGKIHDVLSGAEPPFDPDALGVIRTAITGPRPGAPASPYFVAASFSDIAGLLAVLESWGPAAAPAVPEIVALLRSHPAHAARALGAIGPAALPAVPALTASALTGDVPAGHAILRLTGDPAPLITAATAVLPTAPPVSDPACRASVPAPASGSGSVASVHAAASGSASLASGPASLASGPASLASGPASLASGPASLASGPASLASGSASRAPGSEEADSYRLLRWLGLIADAGTDAAVLVSALIRLLDGAPDDQPFRRRVRVAAARAIWRATGDAELVLPALREVVRRGSAPAGEAAELLAELGAGEDLQPELRKLVGTVPDARAGAALALHRLGVPAEELAGPLVAMVPAGGPTAGKALDTLARIGAVTAIPVLAGLADRDERFPAGVRGDGSWADEATRDRIRATITALEACRS